MSTAAEMQGYVDADMIVKDEQWVATFAKGLNEVDTIAYWRGWERCWDDHLKAAGFPIEEIKRVMGL